MHIGIDVSISLCSPWQLDITRFLRKGKNTLRISVANTLMNRMILDASLPQEQLITLQTDCPMGNYRVLI